MAFLLAYGPNAKPSFTGTPTISGTAASDSVLTGEFQGNKENSALTQFYWRRHSSDDGSDPIGVVVGTQQNYVLTGADVGSHLTFAVRLINNAGSVEAASDYTAAVVSGEPPVAPVVLVAATITGTLEVGQTIGVDFDFDGESSVTYEWWSYETEQRTGGTLLGTAATYTLTLAEDGLWIGADVRASNAAGSTLTRAIEPMAGVDPWQPALPAEYTVPAYDITGMNVIDVAAGGNLQAAIDAAMPGDVIRLEAGATFSGNFKFKDTNANGTDWIYVISSAMASLPAEGTRVTAEDAAHMPKIQASSFVARAMWVWQGVKKVRFVGIEFTTAYSGRDQTQYTILPIGHEDPYDGQPNGSGAADEIIFDRCYIHGTPTGNNRDGFVLYNVRNFALVDSAVQDFHGVGVEGHAVHVYTSPGPVLLRNNLLEAAGINLFVGDSYLPNFTGPKDITVIGNYIRKPESWYELDPSYAGVKWLMKNIFECKGGERIRIEGNILENNYIQGEQGGGALFLCMGASIYDVTIRNNIMRYTPAKSFVFAPTGEPSFAAAKLERVLLENNLVYGNGKGTTVLQSACFVAFTTTSTKWSKYVTIAHNSFAHLNALQAGSFMQLIGYPTAVENVDIRDNLYTAGTSHVVMSGSSPVGFNNTGMGYRLAGTWYYRHNAAMEARYPYQWFNTPTENIYGHKDIWTRTTAKVANIALDAPSHFVLDPTSPAADAATDGSDIGCDVSALLAAIALYNDTTP